MSDSAFLDTYNPNLPLSSFPSSPSRSRSQQILLSSPATLSRYHASLPPLPTTPRSRHLSSLIVGQEEGEGEGEIMLGMRGTPRERERMDRYGRMGSMTSLTGRNLGSARDFEILGKQPDPEQEDFDLNQDNNKTRRLLDFTPNKSNSSTFTDTPRRREYARRISSTSLVTKMAKNEDMESNENVPPAKDRESQKGSDMEEFSLVKDNYRAKPLFEHQERENKLDENSIPRSPSHPQTDVNRTFSLSRPPSSSSYTTTLFPPSSISRDEHSAPISHSSSAHRSLFRHNNEDPPSNTPNRIRTTTTPFKNSKSPANALLEQSFTIPPSPLRVAGNPFDTDPVPKPISLGASSLRIAPRSNGEEEEEDLLTGDTSFMQAMGMRRGSRSGAEGLGKRSGGGIMDVTLGDITIASSNGGGGSEIDKEDGFPLTSPIRVNGTKNNILIDTPNRSTFTFPGKKISTPIASSKDRTSILNPMGLPLPRSESRKHLSTGSKDFTNTRLELVEERGTPAKGLLSGGGRNLQPGKGQEEETPLRKGSNVGEEVMGMKITLVRPSDSPTGVGQVGMAQEEDHGRVGRERDTPARMGREQLSIPTTGPSKKDRDMDVKGNDSSPARLKHRAVSSLQSKSPSKTRSSPASSLGLPMATTNSALQASTILPSSPAKFDHMRSSQAMLGSVDLEELKGLEVDGLGSLKGMPKSMLGARNTPMSRLVEDKAIYKSPAAPLPSLSGTPSRTSITPDRSPSKAQLRIPSSPISNIGDETLAISAFRKVDRLLGGSGGAFVDLMHGEMSFMKDLEEMSDDDDISFARLSSKPHRSACSTPASAILRLEQQRARTPSKTNQTPSRTPGKHLSMPASAYGTPVGSRLLVERTEDLEYGKIAVRGRETKPVASEQGKVGEFADRADPELSQHGAPSTEYVSNIRRRIDQTQAKDRPRSMLGPSMTPSAIHSLPRNGGATIAGTPSRTPRTIAVSRPASTDAASLLNSTPGRTALLRRAPASSDAPVGSPRAARLPALSDAPMASPRMPRTGEQASAARLARIDLPKSPRKETARVTAPAQYRPTDLPRPTSLAERQKARNGTSPEKMISRQTRPTSMVKPTSRDASRTVIPASRSLTATTTTRPRPQLSSGPQTQPIKRASDRPAAITTTTPRFAPAQLGMAGRSGLPQPATRTTGSTQTSRLPTAASSSGLARKPYTSQLPRSGSTSAIVGDKPRRTTAELLAALEARKVRK